jgi:hypothetical protein
VSDSVTPAPGDSTIDKVTLGVFVSSLQRRQEKRARQGAQPTDKETPQRVRLVLQIDPLLLGRIQVQAERLGLTLSTYLAQAATRRLEADEAADPAKKKAPAKRPAK